jgi:hypothetical protein
MYREIENKLHPPFVSDKTTDLQAGFLLGQAYVMKMLRDGYTIGA